MEIFYNFLLLALALFLIARGARLIVLHAPPLAALFGISTFLTSFLVIGVISVFPELAISVISGVQGVPTLGLGTLFGSNVADLTLVLGIATLFAKRGLVVKSDFLKDDLILIAPLLLPIFLGIDGRFSQFDGGILVTGGLVMFVFLYKRNRQRTVVESTARSLSQGVSKTVFFFLTGLVSLLGGAYATVVIVDKVSDLLLLPEILMGISFVTLGTLMPELTFAIKASRQGEGELVLGDILGIVITDATLVLGIMALLTPFSFNPNLISVTGFAMVFAAIISLNFMKSGRLLAKNEGVTLILLYVLFLAVAFSLQAA